MNWIEACNAMLDGKIVTSSACKGWEYKIDNQGNLYTRKDIKSPWIRYGAIYRELVNSPDWRIVGEQGW